LAFARPSAISSVVYFTPKGLLILPALKSASPDSLSSNFTILTTLFVAFSASFL